MSVWSSGMNPLRMAVLAVVMTVCIAGAVEQSIAQTSPASPSAAGTPPAAPASPPTTAAPAAPKEEKAKDDKPSSFWDGGGAVLIGVLPTAVWAVFMFWALKAFFPQVVALLGRLKAFKGFGLELEFLEEKLDDAAAEHGISINDEQKEALLTRVHRDGEILKKTRILWVDDVPAGNVNEERFLKRLGARIDWVRTTAEAVARLSARNEYQILIADMARPADPAQGLDLLAPVRAVNRDIPIVIYCGTDQRALVRPAGLFGITNRPDEFLHLVFDVRERQV